jgi:chromosome segregation ATPase
MKRTHAVALALGAALALLVLPACGKKKEQASGQKVESEAPRGKVTAGEVAREVKTAVGKAVQFAKGEKDAYVAAVEVKLETYRKDIQELKQKAQTARKQAKAKIARRIKGLERKEAAARQRLEELKKAGEEKAASLRVAVDDLMARMEKTYRAAVKLAAPAKKKDAVAAAPKKTAGAEGATGPNGKKGKRKHNGPRGASGAAAPGGSPAAAAATGVTRTP